MVVSGMNGYGQYGGVNSNGYTYTSGWDPKMYCRQRPVGKSTFEDFQAIPSNV